MPCERGTVKLEDVFVDVVLTGENKTILSQCLIEDNPSNVKIISNVEEGSGDIVVLADSEFVYPYGFLARLTKHFADPGVVAVSGARTDQPLAGVFAIFSRPMMPGACAFRRSAWTGDVDSTASRGKYVFEAKAVAKA